MNACAKPFMKTSQRSLHLCLLRGGACGCASAPLKVCFCRVLENCSKFPNNGRTASLYCNRPKLAGVWPRSKNTPVLELRVFLRLKTPCKQKSPSHRARQPVSSRHAFGFRIESLELQGLRTKDVSKLGLPILRALELRVSRNLADAVPKSVLSQPLRFWRGLKAKVLLLKTADYNKESLQRACKLGLWGSGGFLGPKVEIYIRALGRRPKDPTDARGA